VKPHRLVSCKHVNGTQLDFEVSKPLECSKAKEAFDCKIKPRLLYSSKCGLSLSARSLIKEK
jgi:hypothetical protein